MQRREMKRLHEESEANPQSKLPFEPSSLGESRGPSHPNKNNVGADVYISFKQKLTVDDAENYLHQVKDAFSDQREKYRHFLNVVSGSGCEMSGPSDISQRVKDILRGHPNLIRGFNMFWPKRYEITLEDDDGTDPGPQNSRPEVADIRSSLNKMKERDDSLYRSFLGIIDMYRKKQTSIAEVVQEVTILLVDHKDLLSDFSRFLPQKLVSALPVENLGVSETLLLLNEGNSSNPIMISDDEAGKEKATHSKKRSKLDLSNSRRCTPSYLLLPRNSLHRHVSDKDLQVLNNCCLSVASCTENSSFISVQPNKYEESLFKCEDDRFELEILVEAFKSYAGRIERFFITIHHHSIVLDDGFSIDGHFTATDEKCIQRLYDKHAREVMESVRKNPCVALPIVLTRVRQKVDEWANWGSSLGRVWADIYAKNLPKALGQRA